MWDGRWMWRCMATLGMTGSHQILQVNWIETKVGVDQNWRQRCAPSFTDNRVKNNAVAWRPTTIVENGKQCQLMYLFVLSSYHGWTIYVPIASTRCQLAGINLFNIQNSKRQMFGFNHCPQLQYLHRSLILSILRNWNSNRLGPYSSDFVHIWRHCPMFWVSQIS